MMLGDAKVFENAQAVPKPNTLECARYPKGGNLMRAKTFYVPAQKADSTFRRAVKPAHQVKDGRLPGPVWAYEASQLTALESEIKPAQRPQTAEKVCYVLYFQKSHV